MGTFEEDRFTWQLFTSKGKFQFGHFDEIQRQHWISGKIYKFFVGKTCKPLNYFFKNF